MHTISNFFTKFSDFIGNLTTRACFLFIYIAERTGLWGDHHNSPSHFSLHFSSMVLITVFFIGLSQVPPHFSSMGFLAVSVIGSITGSRSLQILSNNLPCIHMHCTFYQTVRAVYCGQQKEINTFCKGGSYERILCQRRIYGTDWRRLSAVCRWNRLQGVSGRLTGFSGFQGGTPGEGRTFSTISQKDHESAPESDPVFPNYLISGSDVSSAPAQLYTNQ